MRPSMFFKLAARRFQLFPHVIRQAFRGLESRRTPVTLKLIEYPDRPPISRSKPIFLRLETGAHRTTRYSHHADM